MKNNAIFRLSPADCGIRLGGFLGKKTPKSVALIGASELLRGESVALFCSIRCPGNMILKTYDHIRAWRDAGISVISGFQSPVEKDCLEFLLAGRQPVIVCPARSLDGMEIPESYRRPLAEQRMLILSPFGKAVKRSSADTASYRNEFVAALATKVFVAYAAPESGTASLCARILKWHKPLVALDDAENGTLLRLGAKPIQVGVAP